MFEFEHFFTIKKRSPIMGTKTKQFRNEHIHTNIKKRSPIMGTKTCSSSGAYALPFLIKKRSPIMGTKTPAKW